MGSLESTVHWRSIFLFPQAGPARITQFYQQYHTQIFTATRNHTQVSSPTWKRDAKRGTTATSTVARRLSCVPTAPSSRKPYLFATGGSMWDANSARLYMQSTVAYTAHLEKTPHDHTDLSQKNFYKTYLYERVYYMCWQCSVHAFAQARDTRLKVQKRLLHKFEFEENESFSRLSTKQYKLRVSVNNTKKTLYSNDRAYLISR